MSLRAGKAGRQARVNLCLNGTDVEEGSPPRLRRVKVNTVAEHRPFLTKPTVKALKSCKKVENDKSKLCDLDARMKRMDLKINKLLERGNQLTNT